jgi:hypothetical protein
MKAGRKTTRRFERQSGDGKPPPSIILTPDDEAILWHVYRHRLLDSESICRLFPHRSPQHFSRRLNLLFRNHYLGRPPRQLELFPPGEGSNPLIYGLDREGARHLKDHSGIRISPYHWLQKNREISRTNIAHTVSTAKFMVALEVSIRESKRARLIHFDELLAEYAPSSTRQKPLPERWQVDINWKGHRGKEGTQPDYIFGIEYLNLPKGKNRSMFFLENDEGTETIEPTIDLRKLATFFRKSSILRKFVIYSFSHVNRAHEKHFGYPVAPRVLTLTTSPARVSAMQDTFRRHFRQQPLVVQPGLFLFTDRSKYEAVGNSLLSITWHDGENRPVHIDDR